MASKGSYSEPIVIPRFLSMIVANFDMEEKEIWNGKLIFDTLFGVVLLVFYDVSSQSDKDMSKPVGYNCFIVHKNEINSTSLLLSEIQNGSTNTYLFYMKFIRKEKVSANDLVLYQTAQLMANRENLKDSAPNIFLRAQLEIAFKTSNISSDDPTNLKTQSLEELHWEKVSLFLKNKKQ